VQLEALQQGVTLSGVGTLGTPKMAQVVAFADELGGRKLHGRPGRRRKARRDLRETDKSEMGATMKPSRNVGLMVLLKVPMWMTRPPRSSEASAGAARPFSCSSLR